MENILLIESDPTTQALVSDCGATLGATVHHLDAWPTECAAFQQHHWGLLLLAASLPSGDGFTLLRRIRAISRVPILFLVNANNEIDGIVGLELGADVFLTKPLHGRALLAQMRALLRRHQAAADSALPPLPLKVGALELDEQLQIVRYAGQHLELTLSEFKLLRLLLQAHGQVLTREVLSQHLLGRSFAPTDRSLDVHISNLRRKLIAVAQQPGSQCIRSERGVGYALTLR
jgi:two-component system response regulator CpxR